MSPPSLEKEQCIQDALSAYQRRDYLTLAAAARAHDVPPSTLRHRAAGRQAPPKASKIHSSQQNLTPLEEEALVDWCKQLAKWGFPPRTDLLRQMAEILLQQ